MNTNLDKWIKDARDDVPDSGEYRRLNRAMLKERMDTMSTSHHRRRHRVLLGSFSLVFLMLFSGQLNQLGSDGFDTTTKTMTLPLGGKSVTVHEKAFGGGEGSYLPGYSEADVDEYHRSAAAGEGDMIQVVGLSYEGKTDWTKIVRMDINGLEKVINAPIQDPKPETPRNLEKFMLANFLDLVVRTESEPPHGRIQMAIDGIMVEFKFWVFEYPGYGKVTRFVGTPG